MQVGAGDTFVDLGAGDGYLVLEAARRGANAIGYELSPIMWAIAWIRAKTRGWRKGSERQNPRVSIRFANFYKQDISNATIVFAFLMPQNMPRLKAYLAAQSLPRAKYLLSYSFPLPGVAPKSTVTVPERGTIYVYDLNSLTKP